MERRDEEEAAQVSQRAFKQRLVTVDCVLSRINETRNHALRVRSRKHVGLKRIAS